MGSEITTLSKVAELGGSIVAIVGLIYIIIKMNTDRQASQKWFVDFVNENNHQKESMISEHTKALVEVKNSITQNTETIKSLVEVIRTK